jgi:DNA-binding HxlR family transcriptional regulator
MPIVRCSEHLSAGLQQAVAILGKRWTGLILYVLRDRPRRFSEIADEIEFVSDKVLSERLKELEAEGIVERRLSAELPMRVEYSLTEKGRDLGPVFGALLQWAGKWLESVPPTHGHAQGTTVAGTGGRAGHDCGRAARGHPQATASTVR